MLQVHVGHVNELYVNDYATNVNDDVFFSLIYMYIYVSSFITQNFCVQLFA